MISVRTILLATALLAAGAPASVAQPVVSEDRYPARRIAFTGGVTGLPDLTYRTIPGYRPLKLDLYLPQQARGGAARPLVIYIHGGAWTGGIPRTSATFQDFPGVLASLAARGYVVASVSYRLREEAPFPAAAQDVKAAIRWLRANAAEYGIDPARAVVWGASAGGQLAALAAATCGVAALEPEAPASPPSTTAQASDCVQGAAIWYGVLDFEQLQAARSQGRPVGEGVVGVPEAGYLGCTGACSPAVLRFASPTAYVDRTDPPFLLIHGDQDRTVPVAQSRLMHETLQRQGVASELVVVPGVDHSFIAPDPAAGYAAARDALARVFAFIDRTIGPRASAAAR